MSEHIVTEHPAPPPGQLFSQEELRQFAADDAEAGSAIGRMLTAFFFYTVIVMAISTLATLWWIGLGLS